MKARRALDRFYRMKCSDIAFTRTMDDYFNRIGISMAGLSAHLKMSRAMRFAAGRPTKMDRLVRKMEAKS